MSLSAVLTAGSIQAAFIAISSRIVGSAFRCLETLNPALQKAQVISDPPTVFVREMTTLAMAWSLALLTNMAIKPLATRRRWSNFWVQFATAVIGTTMAESIGRFVAYRQPLTRQAQPLEASLPDIPAHSSHGKVYMPRPLRPLIPPSAQVSPWSRP